MAIELKIGRLAEMTRTTAPTIRYYEEIGLLPVPARQSGSQRIYDEADIQRLTFIRRCRDFGFPIEKVRQLAVLVHDSQRPCQEARDLAHAQLLDVRQKLVELRELEQGLEQFVDRCDISCPGGVGSDCVMLEELSQEATAAAACCPSPRKQERCT